MDRRGNPGIPKPNGNLEPMKTFPQQGEPGTFNPPSKGGICQIKKEGGNSISSCVYPMRSTANLKSDREGGGVRETVSVDQFLAHNSCGDIEHGVPYASALFQKPIRTVRALYEGSYALPRVSSYRACVRSESHVLMGRIPCSHLRMHREKEIS